MSNIFLCEYFLSLVHLYIRIWDFFRYDILYRCVCEGGYYPRLLLQKYRFAQAFTTLCAFMVQAFSMLCLSPLKRAKSGLFCAFYVREFVVDLSCALGFSPESAQCTYCVHKYVRAHNIGGHEVLNVGMLTGADQFSSDWKVQIFQKTLGVCAPPWTPPQKIRSWILMQLSHSSVCQEKKNWAKSDYIYI